MHRPRQGPRPAHGFGVRTSVAVTDARGPGGRFVPGAKTLPGNPHDGHSLAARIGQSPASTAAGCAPIDRGCRGHGVAREGLQVVVSRTRGLISPAIRRETRRRNAIEPVPGHMKTDGLPERNHLHGHDGDAVNAILAPSVTTAACRSPGSGASWRA